MALYWICEYCGYSAVEANGIDYGDHQTYHYTCPRCGFNGRFVIKEQKRITEWV